MFKKILSANLGENAAGVSAQPNGAVDEARQGD